MQRALPLLALARGAGRRALDVLLPARCLGCGAVVDEPGALCAQCWSKAGFIGPPHCACCGVPFELAVDDPGAGPAGAAGEMRCAACVAREPPYNRARAALRYEEGTRGLVLRFKHADATHAAPGFARWMARAGAELLPACDMIAPVPLHRWRLFWRRYNQAGLLALELARLADRPALPDLLRRVRATPSQGRLDRARRRTNIAGAFALHPRHAGRVAGKRVLLVDDVMTTGATVEECAKVLRRAGAAAVDVLTLARVVRPL